MNLTYEIKENGYIILKDGVPWIVQDNGVIPYRGETMEQSAVNHINDILATNENLPDHKLTAEEEIAILKKENEQFRQSQTEQDALIMELMLGGM